MAGVSEREVLEHILDGSMKPTDIELSLLKDITNKFSEDLKIGQGGFGTVYKVKLTPQRKPSKLPAKGCIFRTFMYITTPDYYGATY